MLSLPVPCYGASSCGRTSPNRSSGKRSLVQTSTSAVKGWRLCMGNRFCNPLELSLRAGGHLQLHSSQSQFGGEDGTVVCAQECRLQMNNTTHMYVVSARGEGLIEVKYVIAKRRTRGLSTNLQYSVLPGISTTAENNNKR